MSTWYEVMVIVVTAVFCMVLGAIAFVRVLS